MYYKFAAAFVLLSLARPIRAPPANSTTTESTLSVSAGFRGGQIELENTEFLLHPPAATTLTAAILSTTTTTTLSHKTPPYTNFPLPLHHSKHDQYQQPRRPPKPHLFWGEQPVVENNEMEEYSLGQRKCQA